MVAFNDSNALAQTGMYLEGAKYMVIQGEAGVVIRGKKVLLHAILVQGSLDRTQWTAARPYCCSSFFNDKQRHLWSSVPVSIRGCIHTWMAIGQTVCMNLFKKNILVTLYSKYCACSISMLSFFSVPDLFARQGFCEVRHQGLDCARSRLCLAEPLRFFRVLPDS